jgi:hypothetical protein
MRMLVSLVTLPMFRLQTVTPGPPRIALPTDRCQSTADAGIAKFSLSGPALLQALRGEEAGQRNGKGRDMRRSHLRAVTVFAGLVVGLLAGLAAFAQHHEGPGFHGDIARFHEHDFAIWRGGAWHHEIHEGRPGWWWVVGGVWYFYPVPIYPYPDPYFPYEPPAVMVPVPAAPEPVAPPPPQYWFYCESGKTYYPYVPTCPGGWRTVTPTTPGAAAPPPPPPAPTH